MFKRLFITIILVLVIISVLFFSFYGNRRLNKSANQKDPENVTIFSTNNGKPVQAQMKNVNFYIDPDIIMDIKVLRGELRPAEKNGYPILDKKKSFNLFIDSAVISIDIKSLSNLLNRYVFNGSSIKDLKISTMGDLLKQEGKMKGIPFSMLSRVSVTKDGKIKLHPDKIKAAGINVRGILKFFKVEIDELINPNSKYGASVSGNDLYLDPARMLPPPKIRGHLQSVKIGRGEIIQIFFSKSVPLLHPDSTAGNYMYYKEGKLGFGKLVMFGTDMEIIDADQKDPFFFFLDHYLDQLTAGYHVTTKEQGLIIYMPDYNDLKK
jgi:hypothetical protein